MNSAGNTVHIAAIHDIHAAVETRVNASDPA
jgi:hypothetical protein